MIKVTIIVGQIPEIHNKKCTGKQTDHAQFDEFEGYEKATEKFKKSLCSIERDSKDSFYNAILYGLVYMLKKKKSIKTYTR